MISLKIIKINKKSYKKMYFRACIEKTEIVHFVALFRSVEDGIAFERIDNPVDNIFEFFVAPAAKDRFIEIMNLFLKENIIISYEQCSISESSLYEKKD
jgi:hypothetical protein